MLSEAKGISFWSPQKTTFEGGFAAGRDKETTLHIPAWTNILHNKLQYD